MRVHTVATKKKQQQFLYVFVTLDMDVDAESSTQGSHPTGMVNGHVEDDSHKTAGDKSKPKLRLTYDEYESMARHLTTTLRIAENRAGDGKLLNAFLWENPRSQWKFS